MHAYHRLQQLEQTYASINLERNILEQKMSQREEYRRTFHQVKAEELQDEIRNIEIQKVKCETRNENLLRNIRNCIDEQNNGTNKLL